MYYANPVPKFSAKLIAFLSHCWGLVATCYVNLDADALHISTRPLSPAQRLYLERLRGELPYGMTLTFDESLPAWAGWLERIKVYIR